MASSPPHTVDQLHSKPSVVEDEAETRFAESKCFTNVCALVILGNIVVIAVQCQELTEHSLEMKQMYHVLEVVFAVCYIVELAIRLYDCGWYLYFFPKSSVERGWHRFDFVVTVVGGADVLYNMRRSASSHSSASSLRLVRVLRVMRVLRIVRFLREVEYTFLSALGSIVRVVILVLMIDFIGAVIITHVLCDVEDEVIREMFGHLSVSMYFLFEVMIDGMNAIHVSEVAEEAGGFVVITHKVMAVYPSMWIFWVGFVFIGTISLMALVPAITVELNLRDAQRVKDERQMTEWNARVEAQRDLLERLFKSVDVDSSNSISREEVNAYLGRKDILSQLGLDKVKDAEDEDDVRLVELHQLRMEFTRVYDAVEAEGRTDLDQEEFIEAFRRLRAKPLDQTVLILQQEIFNLRTVLLAESYKIQARLDDQITDIESLRAELSAEAQESLEGT